VTLTASNSSGASSPATRTVTVSSGAPQTQFLPTADSYVVLATPDTNYGTDTELHGKLSTTNEKRPYFTFAVSGLAGKTVVSAKLRLYILDPSPSGGSWYAVSPSWVETGPGSITWNNAPPITGTPFATAGPATLDTWLEIDASSVVTREGTYGFAVVTQGSDTVYFASRESSNPPELVVTLQ
jgi:hypothetical protein